MSPPSLGAAAEAWASFSLRAHSSQHTSTVLPPILTLMELAPRSQSQAAQVFSAIKLFSFGILICLNTRNPGVASRPCRRREPLSESLATVSFRSASLNLLRKIALAHQRLTITRQLKS